MLENIFYPIKIIYLKIKKLCNLRLYFLFNINIWFQFFNRSLERYICIRNRSPIDDFIIRTANPLFFEDIESILLIMVGFLFSFYSSIHGYRLDDPYPGYGPISRRYEEIVEDYNEATSEIQKNLKIIKMIKLMKILATQMILKLRFNVIKEIVNELTNYIERFDQYMVLLVKYCNAVLLTYRQENERSRSTSIT